MATGAYQDIADRLYRMARAEDWPADELNVRQRMAAELEQALQSPPPDGQATAVTVAQYALLQSYIERHWPDVVVCGDVAETHLAVLRCVRCVADTIAVRLTLSARFTHAPIGSGRAS